MTFTHCTIPSGVSTPTKSKPRAKYKLVEGVGSNNFPTPVHVNGKFIKSYIIWGAMLRRCYSSKVHKKLPTYIGCSVAKEWLLFSNFERWFADSYVEGWHLDKDILVPGNRVYSAEACVFVSQALNSLLNDNGSARGLYPLGVCFHKATQKYASEVCTGAGRKHLGVFTTPLEAHQAWQVAKAAAIEFAETSDPRIRAALTLRAEKLRDDHANGRITTKL